jgi:hypothetical protein
MKTIYRGHEIIVERQPCLAGYPLLYFSVFRCADGFECLTSYEDSAETVREKIKQLKARIDNELLEDDPWLEREGLAAFP